MSDAVVMVPQQPPDGHPRKVVGRDTHQSVPWRKQDHPGYFVALARTGCRRDSRSQGLADEQQRSAVRPVCANNGLFSVVHQALLTQSALAGAIAGVLGKDYS